MTKNRRDFIKTSAALTILTVSKAAAQGPLAVLPRHIGIVHSTEFNTEFSNCFYQGLGAAGWAISPTGSQKPIDLPLPTGGANPAQAEGQYGGSYGHGALEKLVRAHHRKGVHLIVVAGGMASQLAAWGELMNVNVPFVYLAGRLAQTPAATDGKYCGVVLNNSARHQAALSKFNVSPISIDTSDVWLVQNANSDMSAAEWNDWQQNINGNRFLFFEGRSDNDETQFANEAKKLNAHSPKGIVVSSDPFFRLKATEFVSGMRTGVGNSVTICYPFADFQLSTSSNDFVLPGGAALSSSDTSVIPNTAYYMLGKQAGTVLTNSNPGQPVPTAPISSVQWDGDNFKWIPI
jgi:hypothetical protein